MPALIGYLVTLVVFLGGGYAGMQWLTTPEDIPAAVAVHRSIEPVKSSRARLLARKKHEAAAEREASAAPVVTTTAPARDNPATAAVELIASAADTDPVSVREPAPRSESGRAASVADKPVVEAKSAVEAASAAKAAAIVGSKATAVATSGKPDIARDNQANGTAASAAAIPPSVTGDFRVEKNVSSPLLVRNETEASGSKRATAMKRRATRVASRKPVMMILRTVEFPDGRREQRLLPMPRYRQAFAED